MNIQSAAYTGEHADLIEILAERMYIDPEEVREVQELSGGVSCRTLLIRRESDQDVVVKQALPRLKTSEVWLSDPSRIDIEATAMVTLKKILEEGTVPRLLFHDQEHHFIGMEAIGGDFVNWRSLLLSGMVEESQVRKFGMIVGQIHRSSFGHPKLSLKFKNRHFFRSLRIEPYYEFSARALPETRTFYNRLIRETMDTRECLVHGDFSPKNILARKEKMVLLDHEVMHFGDGSFDIGFALTHFLCKSIHVQAKSKEFLRAGCTFWQSYNQVFDGNPDWERRAVNHTLGCMIARIVGKSPLEYLNENERQKILSACLRKLQTPPDTIEDLIYQV